MLISTHVFAGSYSIYFCSPNLLSSTCIRFCVWIFGRFMC